MTQETNLGKIEISPTAIASLATKAVLKCYGVVGMASPDRRYGLVTLFRRNNYRRGVKVQLVEDQIIIDLYVITEYGMRISEVTHNIMSNVKFSVEKALGVPVSQVNVHVQGLRISDKARRWSRRRKE